MNKLYIVLSILLIAGCTAQNSNIGGNASSQNQTGSASTTSSFSVSDSQIAHTYSDLPFLSSATPGPDTRDVPINNIIVLYFKDNYGYNDYSFSLYERRTGASLELATTTFDSFITTDLGLKPLENGELTALSINTEYVLQIERDGEKYYYEFTTGGADNIPPVVQGAFFQGDDLVVSFSERVKDSNINANNIDLEKDGVDMTGDFAHKHSILSIMEEDKKYYIPYNGLTPGTYRVTVVNVKDIAGNPIPSFTMELTKQ